MTWYARKIYNATFDWITFKVVKYDLQTKMYLVMFSFAKYGER
jgi:hypothetical protein